MSQLVPVTDRIKKLEAPFSKVNAYSLDFKSEALFAKQQLLKNSFVRDAAQNNPDALGSAILNVAAIGISLNPATKHAYLVPRSPAKGQPAEICLDISYLGLVKLATDSGAIEWAKAILVYEGDNFVWRGPAEPPIHEADVLNAERINAANPLDNLKGGYCLAKLATGEYMVDVMTAGEILKVRDASKAKNGPWAGEWAGEMAKKTLVKRASKSWPQSSGRDRIDTAIHVLNQHEGLQEDAPIDEAKVEQFLGLVATGSPISVLNFMTKADEELQNACYNIAPKGEKTKFKQRVTEMMVEARGIIDTYKTEITELAEAQDPAALEHYDELDEDERTAIDPVLTDITHRQLDSLRKAAA